MTVEDIDETRPLLVNANADAGDKSARALAAVVRRLSMISESFLIASSKVIPMSVGVFLAAMDGTIVVSCIFNFPFNQGILLT